MSRHGGADPTSLVALNRDAASDLKKLERLKKLDESKFAASDFSVLSMPIGHYGPQGPQIPGFRHFMGTPTPEQSFKIYGLIPHGSLDNTKKLRSLMSHLALCLAYDFDWPAHSKEDADLFKPPAEPFENPHLPAGYSYLLQLVAHDLVQTSLPISILEDTSTGTRNVRGMALRLATIYGDGPAACPFAYALDNEPKITGPSSTRTCLRLGRMADMDKEPRDIARSFAENVPEIKGVGATEPLIADPRNDDHAILAQLTALFHHLHNGVLGLLPPRDDKVMADSLWEAAFDRYLCARDAVTLIYRNVVRKDLMKRILHGEIYKRYSVESPIFLDSGCKSPGPLCTLFGKGADGRTDDWRVPLEFSHAAFRFAHAMVRDKYQLNDHNDSTFDIKSILTQNSALNSRAMPLDHKWIVRWSRFFAIGATPPNLSMRIGPRLSANLNVPDEVDEHQTKRLAYRDLLSSGFVGLWSVDALIKEIEAKNPDLIKLSPLLASRDKRVALVKSWLEKRKDLFDELAIETLSNDPPLYLFILLEAAYDPGSLGLRLGVLGSIIVAEVVFRALVLDPLRAEVGSGSLQYSLSELSKSIYGKNCLHDVPEIETMADLVRFTAKAAKLESATPPFL